MSKKNKKKQRNKRSKQKRILLPKDLERKILGFLIFLVGVILLLCLMGRAGKGGEIIKTSLVFLLGRAVLLVPLGFFLYPFLFLKKKKLERFNDFTIALSFLSFILLISALLVLLDLQAGIKTNGGKLGSLIIFAPLRIFSPLVAQIIIGGLIFVDLLVFYQIAKGLLPAPSETKFLIGPEKEKISEPQKTFKPEPTSIFRSLSLRKMMKKGEKPEKIAVEIEKPFAEPLEYKSPPLKLLEKSEGAASGGDIKENSQIIKQTLENFGIEVRMGEMNVGPTVTQYTLEPAPGIKLSRITALSNNLALALASHPIRIEAPIPGRSLVGVEVPNKKRAFVRLKEMMGDPQFQNAPTSLNFALGEDVSGKTSFADLARMPHLLVAGSTGGGKTVCLNAIIMSLLYKNSPKILRLVLVDPKRVEFVPYNGLSHLLCPIIYDVERTVGVLSGLVGEMERRFSLLSETGTRDIIAYNRAAINSEIMPYIVLIVDELADLMAARGREVEAGIVRLAQMARAVGIHLVIATQRPSVDVLTGLIKANITSRISFQVASQVDSRTVLDMAGAEKLLGLGDMLFISSDISKPKRIQGVFASSKEIERVVNWIKEKQGGVAEDKINMEMEKKIEGRGDQLFYAGSDPLLDKAKEVVFQYKKGSASLLQRKLSIGYARAARLIDMLEKEGIVGPADGSKAREVYIDTIEEKEEF